MAKQAKPEEIIAKLKGAKVRLSQGERVGFAVKSIGVSEQTYFLWYEEYGGFQVNQAKRSKDMNKENARLRKAMSDPILRWTTDRQPLRASCLLRKPCPTKAGRHDDTRNLS